VTSNVQPGAGQGMRYQRLIALGSGGMANVHLALALGQSGFKRLVVVKSVRDELVADTAMRQMFLAEARLSARLNHPNVVQVSEVVEAEGGVMLVMEYLDGLPLSGVYRTLGDAFTLPMRLRVLCEVLTGLQYAHDLSDYHGAALGIVHRDVSPQNVFLTYDGRVKLLDFGIAKVNASQDRTRTGVIKGRIAYMPLEQVTGKAVDRRTDVYAVGCLLWEAVASQRMWGRLTEPQLVREVVRGNIPKLGEHVVVDPELERIVTKATAQLPIDRYESAEALRLDIEGYLTTLEPMGMRDVGELLSHACSDARAERKRELAAAIATTERELSSLVETESSRHLRSALPDGTGSHVSGIASRPRSLRSFSPTPGPYLLPSTITTATAAGATPAPSDGSKSSSVSVQLQAPRRRGFWIVLGAAAALALAAWLPTLLRAPAAAPQAVTQLPPVAAAASVVALPSAPAPEASETETESAAPSASAAPKRARGHVRYVPPPAAAAPAAVKARPPAGCDPPYYFNAGIKTYKPECI
jgi:eukaryotic-like serine/threonine-protein kinase